MAAVETDPRVIASDIRGRQVAYLRSFTRKPGDVLVSAGKQFRFYVTAVSGIRLAVTRYQREVLRLIMTIVFGSGALATIGGTVVTVAFLTGFAALELGLQGYTQLGDIGIDALTGFISAYVNTRLVAPLIAGIALTATVGAGFTAQLGAMRVNEEIDALEVMSIRSVPYLVSTRIVAGFAAVIPLYAVATLASFLATRVVVTWGFGQSAGAYDHYFNAFLVPSDLIRSMLQVVFMAVVIMAICSYYGYTAHGGPAGVGRAVGSAVKLSLVAILFTDMLLSFALYGSSNSLHVSS